MKKLRKIVTVRRIVALAMLCTLLLSSTAVYADTVEDVNVTSEEVVQETSKSVETSSSDKIEETKTEVETKTEAESEKKEETLLDVLESKVKAILGDGNPGANPGGNNPPVPGGQQPAPQPAPKPTCDKHVLDETKGVTYEPVEGEQKDEEWGICSVCGEKYLVDTINCQIDTAESIEYESTDDDHHMVSGKCLHCKRDMNYEEKCDFSVQINGTKKWKCSKEGCVNVDDRSDQKVVLGVSYEAEDGTPIEPSTIHKYVDGDNSIEYKVFDKKIKVVATVSSELLNDEDEDVWANKVYVNAHYYYNGKFDDMPMNLINLETDANGNKVGTYAWTTPEELVAPITISNVNVKFSMGYKKLNGLIRTLRQKKGKEYVYPYYIVRNVNPTEHINLLETTRIYAGDWEYDGEDNKWYSSILNENRPKDITVVYEGLLGGVVDNATLTEQLSNEAKGSSIKQAVDPDIQYVWTDNGEGFIGYQTKLAFNVPADTRVKDGEHVYKLSGSMLGARPEKEDTVSTFVDNTVPDYRIKYISTADKKNEKYYAADVTVEVEAVDEFINYNKSFFNVTNQTDSIYFDDEETNIASALVNAETVHVVEGQIVDLAGNTKKIEEDEFIVDKTAPKVYVTLDGEAHHEKYFNADRTATIKLEDENLAPEDADIHKVDISSKVGTPKYTAMTGSEKSYTGTIVFNEDGVYQIRGCSITDRAGNTCEFPAEGSTDKCQSEFVIDKTAPTFNVEFDNNSAQNGMYYKAGRTATISFKEVNFDKDLVTVTKNSGEKSPLPALSAYSNSEKKHVTKLSFNQDGRYGFIVDCEDLAGNTAKQYVSDDFVIDLTMPELEITGVQDMSANNGVVVPVIKSKDTNITQASTEISLTGSNNGKVNPSIRTEGQSENITYTISDLAHEKSNDDLYTLNVKLTDLAGNVVEKTLKYSINRFGSIFVLSDATKAMVDNYYVTSPRDVVVTEINVDELTYKEVSVSSEGNVKELSEGRTYKASDYTNNKGWHSISYTVDSANFKKDSVYTVTVYSEDRASNKQSNQTKDAEVEFLMDATAPSVVVAGLENEGVYEEASHDFSINAVDTMGVSKMSVIVNGEKIADYTGEELLKNGGTEVFTLSTKDDYQKVEVICSDVAGNETKLAYNNILVSEKAEELIVEGGLTPTYAGGDKVEDIITGAPINKIIIVFAVIAAIALIGGGVVVVKKSK
ncbi:Ig-like domain (group 3) [Pseudobutyrivibrio sp. OR37]|uniref:Ig-like domain-containing protein n=1 Tax=Pseudobutyrivibrio sp. OR37 TaxID=1798186 RepID=UPI0008EE37B3|nr:Ig-like domain-containing protein [Pseudobutyrivibrio sp. OR37]SFI09923.1 Ig-like domain (group 3) [Pseudobutyrivibrio sp. OR37]